MQKCCGIIKAMGEFFPPLRQVVERDKEARLLEFLMQHAEMEYEPAPATRIFFGLDDILFKRYCETETVLQGSWRPDTPDVVEGLLDEGYAISILSNADSRYMTAAMKLYELQFKFSTAELFDGVLMLRDFSEKCNRGEAFPAIAAETRANENKHSIFVDSFVSSLVLPESIDYIYVPHDVQYHSLPQRMFETAWV
jgi:hypothetical protein